MKASALLRPTVKLEDAAVKELGSHRLKDLSGSEPLFQVTPPGLPSSFPPLATLDLLPNNLPNQPSALVGREDELAQLHSMLGDDTIRLVTLTGPGGTGKTRLALQAAADRVDWFDDGVYFVDLSAQTDPDDAYPAIARSIDLDGCVNFRDLGGYPTEDGRRLRWRLLYRIESNDMLADGC